MTALARGDVETFLAAPDPRKPVILIHGGDAGLVSERAARLSAALGKGAAEPPELLKLDGDEIAADPLRLLDEANAMSLFGGRRIIRIRIGSKNVSPAVEQLLRAPPTDATVVLEAGDLRKTAPVRTLCERSPAAAVIACFADDASDIRRMLGEAARQANVAIAGDAVDAFVALVGADRLSTRGEIDKLIAYAQGAGTITAADVEEVVADAGAIDLGEAVDGAFGGDLRGMLSALSRLATAGERPDRILASALNHAWSLAQGAVQLETGQPARQVVDRSGIFYRRRPSFERQLQIWRREGLASTIRQLGEAILEARANASAAANHLDRALLRIALTARKLAN